MVALAPPVVDLVRRAVVGERAAERPRLHHVALIPDQLVPGAHRAAPEPVGGGAGVEREVDGDRRPGDVVDVEVNRPERLGDVDADGADGHRVRVAVIRADVVGDRRSPADPAQLQAVHLLAGGEVGERQDDDVAEAVAGMEDEEQAFPPVLVVRRHVGQWLGDLVDEQLVHRGELDHDVSPIIARAPRRGRLRDRRRPRCRRRVEGGSGAGASGRRAWRVVRSWIRRRRGWWRGG